MSSPESTQPVVCHLATTEPSDTAQFTVRTYDRPNSDHPIYNLVGQIASAWAHFEHAIDRIIWVLAEIPPERGACITGQMMGVWPRFNTVVALLTLRSKAETQLHPLINSVNKMSGRCRDVGEQRNRIIHDPWYVDPTGEQAARRISMPKSDLRYGIRDHDREQILATLADINRLSDKTSEIGRQIASALATSSKKRP